jgi:tRNA nucleotidyltransferase/poly(A) polymerase
MAIIETKTKESIIKNGYLLETLSRERIWDEIKKSFSQSKDFNEYLKYILDFKLSQYIFPGVKINTDLVDSKDFVVIFTNLFKLEDTKVLESKLVQEFKIETEVAKKIIFLLEFSKMKVEDVFDLYKKKVASGISDSTILEWLKVTGNESNTLIKFIDYKPTVSAQELMDRGIKGKELGLEIKRLEVEKFKEML